MSESKQAKVTVDLTLFKKGMATCNAIIHTGTLEQPEELTIEIDGISGDDINQLTQGQIELGTIFGNTKVTGSLDESVVFEADLTGIKGIEFDHKSIRVSCYVGPYSESRALPQNGCEFWKFRLANIHFSLGDVLTHHPPPFETVPAEKVEEYQDLIAEWRRSFGKPELTMEQIKAKYKNFRVKGGVRRNRITFTFAKRTWLLDDDLQGQKNLNKINQPIVSGTLSTEWIDGDTNEAIERFATDITELLTFALARDVKWVSFGCFSNDGGSNKIVHRTPGLLPFNQGGSATVDNWEPHNLKSFLEASHGPHVADRDWWSKSIGLLTQARGAKYLEVQCSLLNTLLDRISSKVNGGNYGNEIDAALNARLDRKWFRWLLHRLLRTLSRNWEQHRTDSLCDNVIKGWNAEPSFPEKVIRACDHLGVPPLSRTKLGFRHILIHSGEMNKKLKTTNQKIDYLFGIEALVLMLMIRMLEFSGQVYLQSNPPDPKPVSEFLAVQEVGA